MLRSRYRRNQFPSFNPVTEASPAGYYRGFGGLPWLPTATLGTSGANGNLIAGVGTTLAGAAVDTFTPARFSGLDTLNSQLVGVNTRFVNAGAMTVIVLAKILSTVAPAANFYDDAALLTDNQGNWALTVSNAGIRSGIFNSSTKQTVSIAQAVGGWFMAILRHDGVTLNCRVRKAGVNTDAAGVASANPLSFGSFLIGGSNYNGARKGNFDVMEYVTYRSVLSDALLNSWASYFDARYPTMDI